MNQLAASGRFVAGIRGGRLKNPNDIYVGLLTSRPVADAMIGSSVLKRRTTPRHDRGAQETGGIHRRRLRKKRIYRRLGYG